MNFVSDNAYGAEPEILAALAAANDGAVQPYGADPFTRRLQDRMSEVFERKVAVFPVATGTAANALALATLCPPHGAILCHAESHVVVDELAAAEFFTHGAKVAAIEGAQGKLTPDAIERTRKRFLKGEVHHPVPSVVTIAEPTEWGTVYALNEIEAISRVVKSQGLKLHVDGARFANALAHLECTPAEASWKLGVDALSFGATKNGALGAEAAVFFNPDEVGDFEFRRMKSGHLLSKMRFVSAQLLAYLEDGRWLKWAARTNALAKRMAAGIARIKSVDIIHPVEANAIFATAPNELVARWREHGVEFLDWAVSEGGRTLVRFMLSSRTPEADVARFLEIAEA